MTVTYLFRIDGAKDNDEFFSAMRPMVSHAYAGIDFKVGTAGWIPDLVRVVHHEELASCILTLIELESTSGVAMVSCRKYLPENSLDIIRTFSSYLDRVIRKCRSSADLRESEFVKLKRALSGVKDITVTTAGSLRSSVQFVEEFLLLDQPASSRQTGTAKETYSEEMQSLYGIVRLSQNEANILGRSVMILDAVIRNQDYSVAAFKSWRGQNRCQPLKAFLVKNE